jgi:hypothetical protein
MALEQFVVVEEAWLHRNCGQGERTCFCLCCVAFDIPSQRGEDSDLDRFTSINKKSITTEEKWRLAPLGTQW